MLALLAAGCTLADLGLDGKSCPCGSGWRCDDKTDTCVRDDGDPREDGGPGDAGPEDGGPTDAGPERPPSLCQEAAPFLFCSGFEDPTFSEWSSPFLRNGTLLWTNTFGYRGSGSLSASIFGPSSWASFLGNLPAPETTGTVHVRAFVYVPSGFILDAVTAVYLGTYDENSFQDGGIEIDLGSDGPRAWSIRDGAYLPTSAEAPTEIPRDQWICLRAEVGLSSQLDAGVASDGSVRLWMDGALVSESDDVTTTGPLGIQSVEVGIGWSSSNQPQIEVRVDEVAVSTTSLPCPETGP